MLDHTHSPPGAACRASLLRVFGTTDLHVHLMPYDYYGDRPAQHFGLAHTAAVLEQMRARTANSLLVDNGDFLQGTPLSDIIAQQGQFGPGDLHPVVAAMNRLGYDAATLGNHEFNYGLPFLNDVLREVTFPVVSANILRARGATAATDHTYRPAWVILTRQMAMADGGPAVPLRIGVIGFAPPQISSWDRLNLDGLIVMRDIVEAAETHVPALRAAGADIVVALCHSGIGASQHIPGMENAALPLSRVPGIDVMITGHTHTVFPGPSFAATAEVDPVEGTLNGVPTVQPGFFGSHLGVVDLGLEHDGTAWHVRKHRSTVEPITARAKPRARPEPRFQPDQRVMETARKAHEDTLSFMRQSLGHVSGPLTSYFVLTAPSPTIRLVADAQRRFAASLLHGGPHERQPLISAVAPFKAGGYGGPYSYVDIPPGPLAMRHAAELYLFPNTLCAIELTGAQIADWLERSAGLFRQIEPGRTDQPLIDPDFACYNFDVLDGLTYRIDPTQPSRYSAEGILIDPKARRVVEIGLNGEPLHDDGRYIVVTNSYRAGGGGMFRAASEGRVVCSTALSARDILIDHIRTEGLIRPTVRATWDFVPMQDTRATFDSGPGALPHMPPSVRHLRPLDSGFERFELSF